MSEAVKQSTELHIKLKIWKTTLLICLSLQYGHFLTVSSIAFSILRPSKPSIGDTEELKQDEEFAGFSVVQSHIEKMFPTINSIKILGAHFPFSPPIFPLQWLLIFTKCYEHDLPPIKCCAC